MQEFLGPEYEHIFSDDFPQSNLEVPSSAGHEISYYADQGSHLQIQHPMFKQDLLTEYLGAMVSTPEERSTDTSNYQTNSPTNAVPLGEAPMISQSSDFISVADKNIGGLVDSETPEAQVRTLVLDF